MKKKLLSFILAICLIMPCALVLTACGGKDPDHTHSWSSAYSHNATQHWKTCSGCDDLGEKNDHTYNVDTCSVCGYVNSNLTPATLQSMDTYFSGVKAEYLKDNFVDTDNQTATFEELLDTQIDVLVQDIIFRLTYVYGYQETGSGLAIPNNVITANLKTINESNYRLEEKLATTNVNHLLTNNSNHQGHSLTNVDLTCIDCYQASLMARGETNYLLRASNIYLAGAIEGRYSSLSSYANEVVNDNNNAWLWYKDSELTDSTYNNYLNEYKNKFKMSIAQILSNQSVTGEYNETSYHNTLKSISNLGYFFNHKNEIINFIKNNIIGTGLVAKDDAVYNCDYFVENNYIVDSTFTMNAPYNDTSKFTTEEIVNSPRLYKGYSIVIPAIVEQALANTFEDTNISLYPKMSRIAYESTTTTTGFATEKEYQTITLMPKANAVTTRLVVKLTGVGSSIGQTIALDYDVVINGTTYSGTKNVTLSATEQEVEIDLNAITNGSTLEAYNGTTTSHTSGNAFNNNDFDAQGNLANSDGNNYIKLDFNNTNNYSFIVTFGGMYNK